MLRISKIVPILFEGHDAWVMNVIQDNGTEYAMMFCPNYKAEQHVTAIAAINDIVSFDQLIEETSFGSN